MTFLSDLARLREVPKTPSEYVSYGLWLVDRAEAIEELVRAAEQVHIQETVGEPYAPDAIERLGIALEKLNRSECADKS